jgi:hypothetical protein
LIILVPELIDPIIMNLKACHVLTVVLSTVILFNCCTTKMPDQNAPVRKESEVRKTAENDLKRYPDNALKRDGIIDVTLPPYLADSTGKKDATSAIQQALKDARDARMITYLPAGRYLVSRTITGIQGTVEWDEWHYEGFADPWIRNASFEYPNVITGPSAGKRAVIVLSDSTPGFNDPGNPKPVLHFWARMEYGQIDKTKPQPNINFNQKIIDIDFELGKGNTGAVAIHHQGAEGSVIEDVNINASGAFAGIQTAPGSGGAIHGVSVRGGQYGFYFRSNDGFRGSQPSPVVSAIRLSDQEQRAILYDGRGPLTIVGAVIEGAGILSDCPPSVNWNGSLNVIDAVIRLRKSNTAIQSNHSVVLENVYIKNADTAILIKDQWNLNGNPEGWIHFIRCAYSAISKTGVRAGSTMRKDDLWVDGTSVRDPLLSYDKKDPGNPEIMISRHNWPHPFPSRLSEGAVNVKDPPYLATGNGEKDDADAIQKAIDENETVFLPKGIYAISKPLKLNAHSKLVGLGNIQTVITAREGSKAFSDPDNPQPLVETVDDQEASTILAFIKLLVPDTNPCVYALCWRAGRNSVVRNVYPIRAPWHPNGTAMGYPMVKIEKSGGGRWFTTVLLHWWDQGASYRHILIENTHEPLSFYMLEPQHGRGATMVEIVNSSNIDIFSVKSEGDYGVISMKDCRNIRMFGYAGNGMPNPGYAIYSLINCNDILLANINPQHKGPKGYGALGISHDPNSWYILSDIRKTSLQGLNIPGTEQFALFLKGNPKK